MFNEQEMKDMEEDYKKQLADSEPAALLSIASNASGITTGLRTSAAIFMETWKAQSWLTRQLSRRFAMNCIDAMEASLEDLEKATGATIGQEIAKRQREQGEGNVH